MATDVVMPQMGESIAEGTITKWLVKPGETVERDQPLFEISTDKVDAEIPSPAAGVLLEVLFAEGSVVPVNQLVARIGEAGEKGAPAPAAAAAAPAPAPPAPAPAAPPAAAPPASAPAPAPVAPAAPLSELEQRLRSKSSPLVRNIAAAEKVDITQLSGTGLHGRVTKEDILGHVEQRKSGVVPMPAAAPGATTPAPQTAQATAAPPPSAKPAGGFHVAAYTASENVVIEPMSKMRQITMAHMRYSKDTSAHVTTVFHMDMSKVHAARERSKAGFLKANATKLSYMPFIFKAVCEGLKSNPKLNSAIDGTNVVFKKDINLGMAVALDWGLIVPVIKNADDLAERARGKKLKPEEAQGGTFTITNPGVFGSLFGTPIINQPQVAILGIGAVEKRPVVVTDEDGNDALVIKTMAYFGISYDHRLVDGADADHFMNAVKKSLLGPWPELEPYS